MIKQLASKEVEDYIKNNPKLILLDVRTEEEWSIDGKPDGIHKSFYRSGSPKHQSNSVNGDFHGKYIEMYEYSFLSFYLFLLCHKEKLK